MLCGAGSLPHEDGDPSSPSSPRGSRRRGGGGNPYSARGLEKFSMVLADLETRREKIMAAAAGSQGVSIIRFMYSNSQDWIPVIVRRRDQRTEANPERGGDEGAQKKPEAAPPAAEQAGAQAVLPDRAVKRSFSWKVGKGEGGGLRSLFRWKDSYYWPAVMVLILLCLATFGRVFAICCTSVWWYLAPAMKGGESRNVRRSFKKDYRRRMSDRRLGGGGGDDAAASSSVKMPGAVDGPASPRHHAAAKRG